MIRNYTIEYPEITIVIEKLNSFCSFLYNSILDYC